MKSGRLILIGPIALGLAVCVLFFLAIRQGPLWDTDPTDRFAWGPSVRGLRAGLQAVVPRAGHQADIRLAGRVRNVGRRPICLSAWLVSDSRNSLAVTDADGRLLRSAQSKPSLLPSGPSGDRMKDAADRGPLQPGETREFEFDLHMFAPGLKAGRYSVVFTDGEVESGPVEVEIAETAPGTPAKAPALVIWIDPDGGYFVEGERVAADEMSERLRAAADRAGWAAEGLCRLRLLLCGHRRAKYRQVQSVLTQCMDRNIVHVEFLCSDRADGPEWFAPGEQPERRVWRVR